MKLNESQKITLTIGQLKKLIKESSMKKTYTKKQLVKGNRRKVNEAVEVPAGTYKIEITVDGRPIDPDRVLTNVDLGDDDRTICTFVSDAGIPDDFFEDEEELYSRELYTGGDEIDIDGEDDENIPSTTEPSYFYENIDDFDNGENAKTCIPTIDYDRKVITFDFY